MIDLRIDLDDIDFDALVQVGRSLIPSLAPAWTDQNPHDPGIMLLELIAWVADAQVYALARSRRSERAAYARLVGLPQPVVAPAGGLIWPGGGGDGTGDEAPPWPAGPVVTRDMIVSIADGDGTVYHPTHDLVLSRARLRHVASRSVADGERDWTLTNERADASFQPFGPTPDHDDHLVLELAGALTDTTSESCLVSIGFDLVPDPVAAASASFSVDPPALRVSLADAYGERPLVVEADTTGAWLRSGVVLLLIDERVRPIGADPTIVLRPAAGGLVRSMALRRIGLNVIPIEQIERLDEVLSGPLNHRPDATVALARRGLTGPPDVVSVVDGHERPWRRVPDLGGSGPADQVFTYDADRGSLTFGNGVNGALPAATDELHARYTVSRGIRGDVAAAKTWMVSGFVGDFGTNLAPVVGGADPATLLDQRALARIASRTSHPLVSRGDLESAALALGLLGVRRAIELPPNALAPSLRGTRTLVVVGPRDVSNPLPVESTAWLREVRRGLVARLPLGDRFSIRGPVDVAIGLAVAVTARRGLNATLVRTRIEVELRSRMALVAAQAGDATWPLGRAVTVLEVGGWVRKIDGVASVESVALTRDGKGAPVSTVDPGPAGLPYLAANALRVTVALPGSGVDS